MGGRADGGERRVLGGRYRLDDILGVGGMSVVWLGHDDVLGRAVAVKLLSGRYAADERSRRRIRDEARAAATLSHPNIAQVYDFGEAEAEAGMPGDGGPVPYIVMELVPGPTLAEQAAQGPLPAEEALRICAEVAAGLAAAHADGLVHRDVKPANVILSPSGAKLVDFGIAAVAGPAALTDTDASGRPVFGTPQYLAPERLAAGPVTAASDVYSLGVMLYKLLTGTLPWPGDGAGAFDVYRNRVAAPLPALPGVPPAVAGLCRRCLARHPASRPSAAEVAAVLRAPAAPARSGLRRTAGLALAGVAGGTAAAVLAWFLASAANHATPVEAQSRSADPIASLVVPPPSAGAASRSDTGPSATAAASGGPTEGATTPPGEVVPVPTAGGPATPPPTTAATTGAPPATTGTFTSAGGTVTAECRDGRAHITAATPTKPYRVDEEHLGPAAAASVTFRHGTSAITMTVTCASGVPAVEVEES